MIKHNQYFEGKVQSLGFDSAHGYATIGIMKPGKYTFSTSSNEKMIITSGALEVKLPGEEMKEVKAGDSFEVASGQSFEVIAAADVSYLCYYN